MLNVLTAYSAQEAIETLSRFSKVDGVVLDSEVEGLPCKKLIEELRKQRSDIPVITVSPSGHARCGNENYHVSSYDPHDLLDQLDKICPKQNRRAMEESDFPPR